MINPGDSGLDYSWSRPSVQAIVDGGFRFVCRYLSWDTTGKNLTADEAAAYVAAGIEVCSNWEYTVGAPRNGFDQGVEDAKEAARQHVDVGGPDWAPVYFSVDFDMTDADWPAVADYFRGVAAVIGLPRTGAYGGIKSIRALFDHGLITYGWQTYAWSYGEWDHRAQVRQVQNGMTLDGATVDYNTAQASDIGGWGSGDDMPTWLTQEDWDAMRWRVQALISNQDTVAGGPTVGEPNELARALTAVTTNTAPPPAPELDDTHL
jgi:hypothetical protein